VRSLSFFNFVHFLFRRAQPLQVFFFLTLFSLISVEEFEPWLLLLKLEVAGYLRLFAQFRVLGTRP